MGQNKTCCVTFVGSKERIKGVRFTSLICIFILLIQHKSYLTIPIHTITSIRVICFLVQISLLRNKNAHIVIPTASDIDLVLGTV